MAGERDGMGELEDLHGTSDSFLAQVEVLLALEEKKRTLRVDDPGFPALAAQVEDLVRRMLARAADQTVRSRSVHETAREGGPSPALDDLGEDHSPVRILGMWRDVERELETCAQGSDQERILRQRSDALRTAYQRAYERERER